MTKILAVDYGKKKTGLAIAEGKLASPLLVIRYKSEKELFNRIQRIVDEQKIEKVVVGISEGKMGKQSKDFSLNLGKKLGIPIETCDETLTTKDAQKLAIEAGIQRKKRKNLEDAFAATIMLQGYLDKLDQV